MAGGIAIDLLTTATDWIISFTLHKPITCSYNCVIEKLFSEGEKRYFPILVSIYRRSMSEISKGNYLPRLEMTPDWSMSKGRQEHCF